MASLNPRKPTFHLLTLLVGAVASGVMIGLNIETIKSLVEIARHAINQDPVHWGFGILVFLGDLLKLGASVVVVIILCWATERESNRVYRDKQKIDDP